MNVKPFSKLAVGLFSLFVLSSSTVASAAVERVSNKLQVALNQAVSVNFDSPAATVFIAQPNIASYQVVNENRIIVFGLYPGDTTLFALDEYGNTCYKTTVSVAYDVSSMQQALKESFPKFNLKLIGMNDGVAVRGQIPTAQDAANVIAFLDSLLQIDPEMARAAQQASSGDSSSSSSSSSESGSSTKSGAAKGSGTVGAKIGKVINQLTVTTPNQVTVKVRIAEVSRKLTDKLEFRWGMNYNDGGFSLGTSSEGIFEAGPDLSTSGLHFGASTTLDALAKEELVSILAEPNLTVVSGETADFIAGGQVPFVTYSSEGDPDVEFKDYGVLLSITPTILSDNRISLRLRPEVSEPSTSNGITFEGISQPGFIVRRAESTVELASGQSFAIAGLLKNDFENSVSKIPGLGDIPILGALARSKSFERGETELVIVATAFISTPSGEPYLIPNEQVYIPSVFERFFLNANPEVS